jgi:hypothetical protein
MRTDTDLVGSDGLRPRLWRGLIVNAVGTLAAILIAFSLDATWDYNADRQRERTYLDALQAELVATRGTIVRHRSGFDRHRSIIEHYLSTVVLAQIK